MHKHKSKAVKATCYDVVGAVDEAREVSVDPAKAIRLAEDRLDAQRLSGRWVYRAEETGEWYAVTREEMIDAGASIMHARGEWYSLWCSATGELWGRPAELLAVVRAAEGVIDDGTDALGVIIREALLDDIDVTAEEVVKIVLEAQREAAE